MKDKGVMFLVELLSAFVLLLVWGSTPFAQELRPLTPTSQNPPNKLTTNSPNNNSSSSISDEAIFGDLHKMEPVTGSWNPTRTSQGYVLGLLFGVSSRGIFIKTLEGSVKLGKLSSHGGYLDRLCFESAIANSRVGSPTYASEEAAARAQCSVDMNPWPFSHLNEKLLLNMRKVDGQYVLLHYRSYLYVPFTDSINYLARVYPVLPDIVPVGTTYETKQVRFSASINYSSGFVEGRIVKASYDGVIRKARELIIQMGNAGNVFEKVSVSDPALFDFAIRAMASNHYLRIYYYRLFGPLGAPQRLLFGYDTNFRAWRIQVLQEPNGDRVGDPR